MSDVKSRPRSHARWSRMFVEFAIYEFCGFWNFEDSENSRNSKTLSVPVLCLSRQRGAREEEASGRAAIRLESVSTHPIMPAMLHERSGPSSGNFKIRDLDILVILGIRDFPCHSHTLPRQRHVCKEAGCESRVRVFRTRFRMSNHARVAPRPLRSKFGETENFRFRNFRSEIWLAHWW